MANTRVRYLERLSVHLKEIAEDGEASGLNVVERDCLEEVLKHLQLPYFLMVSGDRKGYTIGLR